VGVLGIKTHGGLKARLIPGKSAEKTTQRKIFSWIFLLTGIVIGLGAFGHDSNTRHLTDEFAKFPALDGRLVAIVFAVWHFCSGCMLVFGAICTAA
jgi:hypothetical protein